MADDVENVLKVAENLELSLDELDDKEFDIPPVEKPPTLESILNETDDDSALQDDELSSHDLLQGDQAETGSVGSQEGILGDKTKRRQKLSVRYEKHGSILRHVVLKGISAQISSAADRIDAGMPTALVVSSLISIGTSHGLVLVFSPSQVLKWCLGSTAVGAQFGAVSALSFNKDCTRLLCGFAKGQITMWDLTNGKLLRTITDAHPPGSAILHVKFTDDLTIAITSDSGGSVFELEFKRLIGVRTCESRCLFSGSRGEVCTIEPLHMHHVIQDHPMKDVSILAMASLSKVLIVTVRPQLKVISVHPLKGDPATLPLLAWQFVIIQVSDRDRVIDPVLAFARDHTICFFQVICNGPDDINVSPLQKTEVPYKLLAIMWMNSRTLLVIDTSERAHVIDVRSEEELEVIDLADVQLVYSTSFYKSLATGGNVSKALAYAGERACYQSLVTYNGQLVFLGVKGIHVMTMRNWRERIDVLIKREMYQEALELSKTFYENKAKAVVGLMGSSLKRKATVAERILEILDDYVTASVTTHCPKCGKMEELETYYQTVVPVCVDYCLMLDRTDLLFDKIFEQFSCDAIAKGTFLECLEPYILSDRLTYITPSVMKDFVEHYQSRGLMTNVEACIVHLDISSLDIHQVVVLCWANGLYDAILYIYNKGMQDYITPLEELLVLLRSALETGKQLTDVHIKLGNKLLVYISCSLAGRAYPLGDIPQNLVAKVKEDVFQCITCLHTKNHSDVEAVYPYLRALLQFDTREFFNVLALAFEEPEFNSQEGIDKRQRVVDILLQIMVESLGFTPTQVGALFTFLARQMARHENTIMVNRVLFEQVLESLCASGEESRHEERQQALLELLNAGGLQHFNEDRLINLAEQAQFFRVCEQLYQKRREFDKILSCYWKDTYRQHQAFSYIKHIMTSVEFTTEEKVKVEKETMTHLQELVLINNKKTAELVLVGFATNLNDVIELLKPNPKVLYEFLQGVFDFRDSSSSAIYTERQINIEPETHELYVDLMCQREPERVLSYLKLADGYRIERILEICRKYVISNAIAFLLEKSGDIQGAFDIILEDFQSRLKVLIDSLTESGDKKNADLASHWTGVQAKLLEIIQLCQRNSSTMEETQRETLWFALLETVMEPQRYLKEHIEANQIAGFKELTRHVLNSMMGHIALPAILQKIMVDPAYSSGKFGEVRELILGMLDTYNYEKTLLHTCNNLVNHDLWRQLVALTEAVHRGIIPKFGCCNLCIKSFINSSTNDNIACFRCGHSYHQTCLRAAGSFHTLEGEETWLCFFCNKTKRGRMPSTSRFQRLPSSPPPPGSKSEKASSKEVGLSAEQIEALDNLRRVEKTPSRLAILMELQKQDRGGPRYRPESSTVLQKEWFQLQLAHPPPQFNE